MSLNWKEEGFKVVNVPFLCKLFFNSKLLLSNFYCQKLKGLESKSLITIRYSIISRYLVKLLRILMRFAKSM